MQLNRLKVYHGCKTKSGRLSTILHIGLEIAIPSTINHYIDALTISTICSSVVASPVVPKRDFIWTSACSCRLWGILTSSFKGFRSCNTGKVRPTIQHMFHIEVHNQQTSNLVYIHIYIYTYTVASINSLFLVLCTSLWLKYLNGGWRSINHCYFRVHSAQKGLPALFDSYRLVKARWLGLEPAFVLDVGIALRWTSPANGTGWSTTGGRSLGQQRNQSKSWAATQKGGKVLNNLVAYGFLYVFCLVAFIGGLSDIEKQQPGGYTNLLLLNQFQMNVMIWFKPLDLGVPGWVLRVVFGPR